MHLASYSDASVLPLLHAAFDRHPIVRGEVFANQALIELEAAIEDLGGELTPAQKDKVGVALEREEELVGQVQCPIETPSRRSRRRAASAIIDCHARARASKADSTAPAIAATTPTPLA
jgi:hypothetical protein